MNLVTRQQQQIEAADLRLLAPWINYLIAAYPVAPVSDLTFAVLEEQLGEYSTDELNAAVRKHVHSSVFWPTVAELRKLLDGERLYAFLRDAQWAREND